ncbi:MAG: M42 family metallopeptidase [Clostridium sp.]|uniref:M42 family metallopeptidase n=1 Tax=Clostridium sp. TaxID=1506 RepID=UPI003EE6947C
MVDLIKKLSEEIGVSGREERVSKLLLENYKDIAEKVIYDNLGSTFVVKEGKSEKRVMVCAHIDESGFIVKEINSKGYLKVISLGDIKLEDNIGQRVIVVNNLEEKINGVVVSIDKDVLIDIGATSNEDVIKNNIGLGNEAILKGEFTRLLNNRITSKALDNRVGCALGIELLNEVSKEELDFDLFVGGTVQNKVGFRGSITSTNLVKPDFSIVLDVLECKEKDEEGKLGEGLLVSFYDKGMMPNKKALRYLINICEENNIKYQHYYSLDQGDGGWIHKVLEGCPTLKISIPGKNIEGNSTIIHMNDYENAKKALVEIIKSLRLKDIEDFKTENR